MVGPFDSGGHQIGYRYFWYQASAGKWEIARLEQMVRRDPGNLLALFDLAQAYFKQGSNRFAEFSGFGSPPGGGPAFLNPSSPTTEDYYGIVATPPFSAPDWNLPTYRLFRLSDDPVGLGAPVEGTFAGSTGKFNRLGGNRVVCLSCHLAHGSRINASDPRWATWYRGDRRTEVRYPNGPVNSPVAAGRHRSRGGRGQPRHRTGGAGPSQDLPGVGGDPGPRKDPPCGPGGSLREDGAVSQPGGLPVRR